MAHTSSLRGVIVLVMMAICCCSFDALNDGDRYERACTKKLTRYSCPDFRNDGAFHGRCLIPKRMLFHCENGLFRLTCEAYIKKVLVLSNSWLSSGKHSLKGLVDWSHSINIKRSYLKNKLTCFHGYSIYIKKVYLVNMKLENKYCGNKCEEESCDYNGCCPNQAELATNYYSRQLKYHNSAQTNVGRIALLDNRILSKWRSKCLNQSECNIKARYYDILIDQNPFLAPDFVDVIYTCQKTEDRVRLQTQNTGILERADQTTSSPLQGNVKQNSSRPLNVSDVMTYEAKTKTEHEKRNSSSIVWKIAVAIVTFGCTALIMMVSLKKLTGQIQEAGDSQPEPKQEKQQRVFMTVGENKITSGEQLFQHQIADEVNLYDDALDLYQDVEYYTKYQHGTASSTGDNIRCNEQQVSASYNNLPTYTHLY